MFLTMTGEYGIDISALITAVAIYDGQNNNMRAMRERERERQRERERERVDGVS